MAQGTLQWTESAAAARGNAVAGLTDDERERVRKYHEYRRDNPRVERLFEEYAKIAHAAGRSKIGVRLVWERIRWDEFLNTDSDPKMPNDFAAFYSRLIMRDNPELEGLFETRRSRCADAAILGIMPPR